jgi:dsRNA-specific ribonuclease
MPTVSSLIPADLQSINQAHLLHWQESTTGPQHAPIWVAVCFSTPDSGPFTEPLRSLGSVVADTECGRGQGSQKHLAKRAAASQALTALGQSG